VLAIVGFAVFLTVPLCMLLAPAVRRAPAPT
jgi:hypothetical protein